MVTNQDGLGTDSYPEDTFWPAHNMMMKVLENEGITFGEVVIDRTFAAENKPTRKPGTALLTHYMNGDYDLENRIVVRDRYSDMQLAKNLRAKGIMIGKSLDNQDDAFPENDLDEVILLKANSWDQISDFLINRPSNGRTASISRTTKETEIKVEVDLDGTGKTKANTGVGFFDHMLDQLARHALLDLTVRCEGDLHIEDHHTVEDIGITLGQAIAQAVGDKKGILRYGHAYVPLDEALSRVVIDFSGRPGLVFDVPFTRASVGGFDVDLFLEFFQGLVNHALVTLHVDNLRGDNTHHQAETVFKAFGRALRMALTRDPAMAGVTPSTKGVL